jgi:hypothetical protein
MVAAIEAPFSPPALPPVAKVVNEAECPELLGIEPQPFGVFLHKVGHG